MAYSNSSFRAQVPLSCQLCEESNQIKWKCYQCDFLLCTKCQKLHKKVKSNDQHTIINIKDIARQQAKDDIPCEIHSGQNCDLFCQTCYEVVCPLCIAHTHGKHHMIELAEGYKLTINKLKNFSSDLVMKLPNYERGRSTLSSFKYSEEFKYKIEKQIILSREKDLKHEVEMHTKNLLEELDQRWDLLKQSVNDVDNTTQKINKDFEFRTESLTNALASVKSSVVFQAYKEERAARKQNIEPVKARFKRLPQYIPGKLQIQQALHGELQESNDDYEYALDHYELKVIKQYKTDLKSIAQIVCCDDGTLWISDSSTKKIQKIQFSNRLVHIVQQLQFATSGMALSLQGDLFFSIAEPYLKMLCHTTGKMIEIKNSEAPLITGPIHITREDKIIIRVGEKGPLFPVNKPRKVIIMDKDGTTEKVYNGLDNDGKPLFSAPQRITSDNDNNIYVLDCLNKDWSGRIVALDKTNGLRWIYSGNADINKEQTFKPRDLVATNLNNVIITDKDSHMIHILNTSGECIHYINTKDQLGIELPYSLDIDNTGTLYIGCFQSKPDEAKIYTVQVSGF
ncbi:tripartite motif-containing protein 71 [Mytilus galloprovincialis]|uniref:Tripartite motif-containing protein 71 n=1 Tax=Mytilus galloprovincialis TaxID=29158 RepID=A0A8B6FFT6_MYTGA|nr:tripartite motif-containing protein 71 [Mytilus galloprovincialis]